MSDIGVKVFPIGRLDKESHGLLILTNDGRITDRLLNPIYEHQKEYVVEVDRRFTPGFQKNMQEQIKLKEVIKESFYLSFSLKLCYFCVDLFLRIRINNGQ